MCESLQLQHWEKHEHYTTSQFLLLMLAYKIFFKPYHAKNGISPGRTAYGSDNDEAKFSVSFPGVLSNSFPGERVMAWKRGSYVLWMLSPVFCISFSCWFFFGIYCYWNYWPTIFTRSYFFQSLICEIHYFWNLCYLFVTIVSSSLTAITLQFCVLDYLLSAYVLAAPLLYYCALCCWYL